MCDNLTQFSRKRKCQCTKLKTSDTIDINGQTLPRTRLTRSDQYLSPLVFQKATSSACEPEVPETHPVVTVTLRITDDATPGHSDGVHSIVNKERKERAPFTGGAFLSG